MKTVLTAIALALTISGSFAATGCVLVGPPAARVELHGQTTSLPLRLANCEGVRIVSGPVSACFVDKKQQRACRQLNQGQIFTGETLGSMEGAGTAAFQATLMAMILGDTYAPAGGSRSTKEIVGLPYANIVGRSDQIVFSTKLQALQGEDVLDFKLTEDNAGAETRTFKPINGTIRIPIIELTRGLTYFWDAHTRSKIYSGTFHLASTDRAESFKRIDESVMNNADNDPISARILMAEKYFDNGFTFDANQILSGLTH